MENLVLECFCNICSKHLTFIVGGEKVWNTRNLYSRLEEDVWKALKPMLLEKSCLTAFTPQANTLKLGTAIISTSDAFIQEAFGRKALYLASKRLFQGIVQGSNMPCMDILDLKYESVYPTTPGHSSPKTNIMAVGFCLAYKVLGC